MQHMKFTLYMDTYDNHPVNIVRVRDLQTLCITKLMRDGDCWKGEDNGGTLSLDSIEELYMNRGHKVCRGRLWHLHLPLDERLLLSNPAIDHAVFDGVVTNPDIDTTPWFEAEFKKRMEEEIHKYKEISAEDFILQYGNPLEMEHYDVIRDVPFTETYVLKEDRRKVMVLRSKCDYAHSDDERYTSIEVVRKQMEEKLMDIQRVVFGLNEEVLSKSLPVPNVDALKEAHHTMTWLQRRRASPWN